MTIIDESIVVPMDELSTVKQDGRLIIDPVSVDRKSGAVKVTITPCQPKTLSHLPKRPPVDIAFSDLMYTVTEGTKNSECLFKHYIFIHYIHIFYILRRYNILYIEIICCKF